MGVGPAAGGFLEWGLNLARWCSARVPSSDSPVDCHSGTDSVAAPFSTTNTYSALHCVRTHFTVDIERKKPFRLLIHNLRSLLHLRLRALSIFCYHFV